MDATIRNVFQKALIYCLIILQGGISCIPDSQQYDSRESLPELPFAQELQDAITGVQLENQDLGIAAAVKIPGYTIWTGASGYSSQDTLITSDMLFDAGSITKNLMAALIMELDEEGQLSLEDPISYYLPALPNVDGSITIRQLLNHTSGVFNVFEHPDFPWVDNEVDYARNWGIGEVFYSFVLEPYDQPGHSQYYSSTNYLLLTEIIRKVTGASAEMEIERRFLNPLGLAHSFISMDDPPPAQYAVAHPWVDLDQDGNLEDLYGIPVNWKATLTHPVLFSTARDLATWMDALYRKRCVISPGSLEDMLTFPKPEVHVPGGVSYGLGVVDYSERLGVRVIGHAGSSLGYSAAALYLPEYEVSLAWLINRGESPPMIAEELMMDIWQSLFDVLTANKIPHS